MWISSTLILWGIVRKWHENTKCTEQNVYKKINAKRGEIVHEKVILQKKNMCLTPTGLSFFACIVYSIKNFVGQFPFFDVYMLKTHKNHYNDNFHVQEGREVEEKNKKTLTDWRQKERQKILKKSFSSAKKIESTEVKTGEILVFRVYLNCFFFFCEISVVIILTLVISVGDWLSGWLIDCVDDY